MIYETWCCVQVSCKSLDATYSSYGHFNNFMYPPKSRFVSGTNVLWLFPTLPNLKTTRWTHEAKENTLSGSVLIKWWGNLPPFVISWNYFQCKNNGWVHSIGCDRGNAATCLHIKYDFLPKSPANIRDLVVYTIVCSCQWKQPILCLTSFVACYWISQACWNFSIFKAML